MRLRNVAVAAGLALSLMSGAARASVTYDFKGNFVNLGGDSFVYILNDFIKSDISVDASKFESCSSLLSDCLSVDFSPAIHEFLSDDIIHFHALFVGVAPFTDTYNFENGALSKAGHYLASDGLSTLDVSVSAVPLPASAPMFGAALLALAGFGYAAKRRNAAAV